MGSGGVGQVCCPANRAGTGPADPGRVSRPAKGGPLTADVVPELGGPGVASVGEAVGGEPRGVLVALQEPISDVLDLLLRGRHPQEPEAPAVEQRGAVAL